MQTQLADTTSFIPRRVTASIVAIIVMLTGATLWGTAQSPKPSRPAQSEPVSRPGKYGGTLTQSTISDPRTFNLWTAFETSSSDIVEPLFEPLLQRNPLTLRWEGRLAELPRVGEGGRVWTFRLRPGLLWSDGHPLTADDVIFTLDAIYDSRTVTNLRDGMAVSVVDPKTKKPYRAAIGYRKLDARTVRFTFPYSYAVARDMLSFPIAPRHKLQQSLKSGRFNSAWGVSTPPAQLVSSGPWVMKSYTPGERVVYERNPRFWKKDAQGRPLPYLQKHVVLIAPDLNTTLLNFNSGLSDVVPLQASAYRLFKRNEKQSDYSVLNMGAGWGFNYLGFNLNPNARIDPNKIKLFQDVRFRRAVSRAVNRTQLAQTLFGGLARPIYSPISSANALFYNPNVPRYDYDLVKARMLLRQMGLRDKDGNGWLEFRGREVKFNIVTNVENNLRQAMAMLIVRDLRRIGLNATFTPLPFNRLISKLDSPSYEWEAIVLGFTGGPEPNDGANIWMSSGTAHQWRPLQRTPATAWEAEIDRLFLTGARTLDERKRRAIYNRWQVIAAQQLPLIYTVQPDSLIAIRKRFGNLKPNSLGGALWNLEEIYDLSATAAAPA